MGAFKIKLSEYCQSYGKAYSNKKDCPSKQTLKEGYSFRWK